MISDVGIHVARQLLWRPKAFMSPTYINFHVANFISDVSFPCRCPLQIRVGDYFSDVGIHRIGDHFSDVGFDVVSNAVWFDAGLDV